VAHREPLTQAIAFLRTIARMAFFVFVLVEFIKVGDAAALTWANLAVAGAISTVLLWLVSTVVAGSVARHQGVTIIAATAPLLRFVHLLTWPLTRMVSFIDTAVGSMSGAGTGAGDEHAEAELLRSIDETRRDGALDIDAAIMLENVVEFTSTVVGEVMTPRPDIEGVQLTDDLPSIRAFIQTAGHSRIPVYRGNLDTIVGILYLKDLIHFLGAEPAEFHLEPLLRKAILVPENKPVSELLKLFQHSEVHMAIVIDEYGGTAGLVTIEDVLEEIVGEIQDEHEAADDAAPELKLIGQRRSEADGRYSLDELQDKLGLRLTEGEYDTIAGFVLAHFGRVPEVGESFQSHGTRFTVLAAEPTQVLRVGIEVLAATDAQAHPSGTQ
jgi:putative hemolysin